MRVLRAVSVAATMGLALLEAPPGFAADTGRQIVDVDGVVHLTNVPADPRYRGLPGSGTRSGALRIPAGRSARYLEDVHAIARQHGVSPVLAEAVARAESGLDPRARSPKGAGGLMQLMPETASALGVVDRFDPRENISGGVRHLRYLLDRYKGSVTLAVAAYNAGEGAVDTHRGIPPYAETRQYVEQVLRHAGMTRSLDIPSRMYRHAEPDGTLTYSNVPPAPGAPAPR
jgi:soluble lytic murein transglycosylase-like protein